MKLFLILSLVWSGLTLAALEQTLRWGNGAEVKDLDPSIVTGVPEHHILTNLFEGLVGKHPETLGPVPGVAESWTISKDLKTYTFQLRKDAKWSNGDPVTANDFIYSWQRLLDPKTAAEYSYQAYYIKNGKDINTGKIKDFNQLGVKAPTDRTLVVTLENPTPFFLKLLDHYSLAPLHAKTIQKHGIRWTRPENMVNNGAFTLDKWETNRLISVKANPLYWDAKSVKLTSATFYPVEKMDTEEKMFRSGDLDITNEIPLEKIPLWKKKKGSDYVGSPYLGTYFYWFNTKVKPLDKKEVRQALSLAIDRDSIVKYVTKGDQPPARSFTPPGAGDNYQPPAVLPTDLSRLAEAKELLAKAGYPNGKGMPTIDILFNTHDGHKKIAEVIQEMWKKNLGVNATLVNQEWKVYLDSVRLMKFTAARQGWIGDYNDPNTFLDMFISDSPMNRSGWKNAEYDALMVKAAKELDSKKRLAHFFNAEKIWLDEMPSMPIYVYTRNYLKNKKVQGWYSNIEDLHPLKYVWIGDSK